MKKRLAPFCFFLSLSPLPLVAQASLTWDSNTSTTGAQDGAGTWNTINTNWWTGTANTSFVSGDNVTFGAGSGAAGSISVVAGGVTAGSLVFNNPGSSSYTFTGGGITGGALTKNGTSGLRFDNANSFTSVLINNGPNSQSDGAIRLGNASALGTAPITFANTGSMTGLYFLTGFGLSTTMSNNVTFSSTAGSNLTRLLLTANIGQTVTLSGKLSGGVNTASIRIDNTAGSGQAITRLTNSSNDVVVSYWEMWRGALEVTSDGALGNVNNALQLNVGASSDPVGTGFRFGADNITLNANRAVTIADRTNVNTQNFVGSQIDGAITFNNTLVKKGSTTLTLNGTVSGAATTAIRIDEGTVQIGTGGITGALPTGNIVFNAASTNLAINRSNTLTYGGTLTGTGGSLQQIGSGTTILNGNNNYAGATTVSNGTLLLNGTNASSISVGINGAFGGAGSTTGSLTYADGSGIARTSSPFTASGGVVFSGGAQVEFFSTPVSGSNVILNYGSGLTGNVNLLTGKNFRVASFSNDVANNRVTADVVVGTRTWNTTDGTWAVNAGTNFVEDDQVFFAGDSVVFNDPAAASAITLSGSLLPTTVTANNTNGYTFGGSGSIAGSGALVKTGSGSLAINTVNTYTGGTTVSAGTLVAGNSSAFGIGSITLNGGTLNLGGQTIANSIVGAGGGIAGNGTVSGTLSGPLTFSSGTTVLTGTISGADPVNITGGSLSVGNGGTSGTIGTGNIQISSGASLNINRSNAISVGAELTGSGSLEKNGAGTLTLTGSNSHGSTTISGGRIAIGAASNIGNGDISFTTVGTGLEITGTTVTLANNISLPTSGSGNVTLLTANNSSTVINGDISGGGTNTVLFFQGGAVSQNTGALTLNGNNTLQGTINIQRGPLILGNANAAGSARILIDSNNNPAGALQFGNSFTLGNDITMQFFASTPSQRLGVGTGLTGVLGGVISSAGGAAGIEKVGSGTMVLTNDNTYTGTTIVTAGSLLINGSNSSTALTTVAGGATLGGTGSIAGAVNVTGILSPGASIESLSTGALTMSVGSTFVYEAADNSSTGADLLVANGTLNLTDVNLDLAGANLGLNTWAPGDKITLISYTGSAISSGFTGYDDDMVYTFGANQWLFDYNDVFAGNNYSSEADGDFFVTMTAIPEPSTALLGGLGMLALLRRRRVG